MNRIIDLEPGRYRLISIGRRTDHAGMTKLPLPKPSFRGIFVISTSHVARVSAATVAV